MARLTLRRTRLTPALRGLTREVLFDVDKFIQPLFVVEGIARREPVTGLNEVFRDTTQSLATQVETDIGAGVHSFLLFGVPSGKRERDFSHDFTCAQIAALRRRFGREIWLAVDVCLCSSTRHGHCGILDEGRQHVDNGSTVEALAAAALAYAEAGADCVAPSDMMDGRVGAIRAALDRSGFDRTAIMSYTAKFHSAFYGPFRAAADSAPASRQPLTDRATYQIDPGRPRDALACAQRDADEGADILMVKPALPCLDVLRDLSGRVPRPWAAYQTSGEQAGLELLAREGLGDPGRLQLETWTAIRRAGADMIISYAARRASRLLRRASVTGPDDAP